ncbi:expressed unknown protein [Seminavis robusta]|uniref:Uncharacterized protein n=1 Tax=Seminavis robusta TaxID=568900 RepID=A0A9N8EK54_9STRA|nr:expressed unknown protein [Seminavis robusta]|eukprot:Sro1117_g243040.1 n/a (101) ;mRNA; r:34303-34605
MIASFPSCTSTNATPSSSNHANPLTTTTALPQDNGTFYKTEMSCTTLSQLLQDQATASSPLYHMHAGAPRAPHAPLTMERVSAIIGTALDLLDDEDEDLF